MSQVTSAGKAGPEEEPNTTRTARNLPLVSIVAGALLAVSAASVSAKDNGHRAQRIETPSRAGSGALEARSARASARGANAKPFCPPGQAKKPGRGSAFRC